MIKLYSWEDGINLITVFIIVFLVKLFIDKLNYNKVNLAFSIRKFGLFIGTGIAFVAPLTSMDKVSLVDDLIYLGASSVMIIVSIFLSMIINDKLLLRHVNNNKMLIDNNISVAIVEVGTFIATGIILFASMSGEGIWWSSILFFILGQVSFILLVFLYNVITKFNIHDLVKKGNISVAIVLSGIMISAAIILKTAIMGDDTTLINDLKLFGIDLIIVVIFVILVLNTMIDKIFLPKVKVYDEIVKDNIPIAITYSSIKIALAFVISSII
jgi:uncharacterized membrane protein YjfL (UPF0719 family)